MLTCPADAIRCCASFITGTTRDNLALTSAECADTRREKINPAVSALTKPVPICSFHSRLKSRSFNRCILLAPISRIFCTYKNRGGGEELSSQKQSYGLVIRILKASVWLSPFPPTPRAPVTSLPAEARCLRPDSLVGAFAQEGAKGAGPSPLHAYFQQLTHSISCNRFIPKRLRIPGEGGTPISNPHHSNGLQTPPKYSPAALFVVHFVPPTSCRPPSLPVTSHRCGSFSRLVIGLRRTFALSAWILCLEP